MFLKDFSILVAGVISFNAYSQKIDHGENGEIKITVPNMHSIYGTPQFNGDGSKLVFTAQDTSKQNKEVYLADLKNTTLTNLSKLKDPKAFEYFDNSPTINKEGTEILFSSKTMYLFDVEKNEFTKLPQRKDCKLSRENSKLVFVDTLLRENNGYEVTIRDLKDSSIIKIPNELCKVGEYEIHSKDVTPSINDDGTKITFTRTSYGEEWESYHDVYLVDLETNSYKRITDNKNSWDSVIKGDGTKLAYSNTSEGNVEVYLYDIETKETINISKSDSTEDYAEYFIGNNLIFESKKNGTYSSKRVYNLETKSLENFPSHDLYGKSTMWTEDNKKFLYIKDLDKDGSKEIYIVEQL